MSYWVVLWSVINTLVEQSVCFFRIAAVSAKQIDGEGLFSKLTVVQLLEKFSPSFATGKGITKKVKYCPLS